MEVVRAVIGYLGECMSSMTEDRLGSEKTSEMGRDWQTEDWNNELIATKSESVPEVIASWVGIALPKRVTVIQDLDPSTVFVLEVCKVIPPEWIGLLAVLGVVFLIVLGLWGLRLTWRVLRRFARAHSRRATPVPSVPNSARRPHPPVSAEVAAVLAAIAANNSSLTIRPEDRIVQHRRRRQ